MKVHEPDYYWRTISGCTWDNGAGQTQLRTKNRGAMHVSAAWAMSSTSTEKQAATQCSHIIYVRRAQSSHIIIYISFAPPATRARQGLGDCDEAFKASKQLHSHKHSLPCLPKACRVVMLFS
jgi:hypothetical protein